MKSLLLIGFPRGFTSQAYDISKMMLPFLKESGIAAGEVLNQTRNEDIDREYPFYLNSNSPKFEEAYQYYSKILDKYTEGYLIKEVIQPYVVLRYLYENPEAYHVVFVNRPLEHIQFSLDRKGWGFAGDPATLFPALNCFPSIDVAKAYYDHEYFYNFLKGIYPEAKPYNYLSPEFIELREKFLADFNDNRWFNTYRGIKNTQLFKTENLSNTNANEPLGWTTAKQAKITFDVPEGTPDFSRIHLKTFLSRCFEGSSLSVTYSLGDAKMTHVYSEALEETVVEFPLGKQIQGPCTLTLLIDNDKVISPKVVGVSDDSRTLGVGLSAVGLFDREENSTDRGKAAKAGFIQSLKTSLRKLVQATRS